MTNLPSKKWPLTLAQQQIWAGQQLDPGSPLYNMALSVEFTEQLDIDRFSTCWDLLQRKYPSIASSVTTENGNYLQIICDQPVAIKLIDCSENTLENARTIAHKAMQSDAELPFKLNSVLTESKLFKLSDSRFAWYLKQHHINTDAWSFKLLWEQLYSLYNNFDSSDSTCNQFEDYAIELEPSAVSETSPNYLSQQYSATPLCFFGQTSGLQQNGDIPATSAIRVPIKTDERWSDKLGTLCEEPEIKSFNPALSQSVALLSLMFVYLHRLSGERLLTIGLPNPNRHNKRFINTPGLFVEVLPITLELDAKDSFSKVCTNVRDTLINHIKQLSNGNSKTTNATPINAIFNFVNASFATFDQSDLCVSWFHSMHADRQHLLRLQITDWTKSGHLSLDIDLNERTFDSTQRSNAVTYWNTLFDAMCSDLSVAIGSVPIVTNTQPVIIDSKFHQNIADLDTPASVLDKLEYHAQQSPGNLALSTFNEDSTTSEMTYGNLHQTSGRIAQLLLKKGVCSGDRVAVHLDRSVDFIACLVAVMQSGAAFIPLDQSLPIPRIQHILQDANPCLIISSTLLDSQIADSCPILSLTEIKTHVDNCDATAESFSLPTRKSDDIAYILYTSGSTGLPKGVMISDAAFSNYISWAVEFYSSNKAITFAFFTSIGFDLTLTSIFVPLASGGQIRIYPESQSEVDLSITDVVKDNKSHIVKLTPSHLAMMQHLDLSDCNIEQFIVGGENLKASLAHSINRACGTQALIHNEYGPTECTVGCVVHTFNPEKDLQGSVPIGLPIKDVSIAVVNDAGIPQPRGVAGELILSGKSLAIGYWNSEDATRAAFHQIKLAGDSETRRFYKTGDTVRVGADGNLIYLGRDDDQIKVKGVRIEVSEIETAVLAHPDIAECLVTVSSPATDANSEPRFCVRCGLSSRYPGAALDDSDVCQLCIQFAQHETKTKAYFQPISAFEKIADEIKTNSDSDYDCIVLLSGGKDSSYALARTVDLGLRVLAFTLDNGYISEQAKQNIKRVCDALKVDHIYGKTDAMDTIFKDSLSRHSNVCHGCFKVLYTLSLKIAEEKNICAIVTGLSRGQFFETRLTGDLFSNEAFDQTSIDDAVLTARKVYHLAEDAVSRCMDVKHVQSGNLLNKVKIIDFYRYCSVDLSEMYAYLETKLPWIRPSDTGRSTNCLINDVGIHVHKVEKGFHNYALPYSWDVRLGHKQREEALEELDDEIDTAYVESVLRKIGYEPRLDDSGKSPDDALVVYYTGFEHQVSPTKMQQHLAQQLPSWMLPSLYVPMDTFPLSKNGKIDRSRLPTPVKQRNSELCAYRKPDTDLEKLLVNIWTDILCLDNIGVDDNYFQLNGDSLSAIRIVAKINQIGWACSVAQLFESATVSTLAKSLEKTENQSTPEMDKPEAGSVAFDSVKLAELQKLQSLMQSPSAKKNST